MIHVVTPTAEQIREIQRLEGYYYWSRLAPLMFRSQGVVSVQTLEGKPAPADSTALVFTRGAAPAALNALPEGAPLFIEGPLSPAQLAQFGVSGAQSTGRLLRLAVDGANLGYIQYPEETYTRGTSPEVLPIGPDSPWGSPIKATFFEDPPPGWQVLAHGRLDDDPQTRPIAIRRGNTILCGAPIFDIAVRHAAVAPYPGRYYTRRHSADNESIFGYWVSLVLALRPMGQAQPIVRVRKWPRGYDSAFTIRFDYDRAIDRESRERLLADLAARSLKCSIGFLSYLAPEDAIGAFEAAGHEIQLHTHADSAERLKAAFGDVRAAARSRVDGVTIHGGGTSCGFLGDTHFDWVHRAGARYIEIFGSGGRPAVPICRIGDDELPYASSLAAMSRHTSLDTGTGPKEHQLDYVLPTIPERLGKGDYFILMNHPDIHREELLQACALASSDRVWRTTEGDCVDWFMNTHFHAEVEYVNGRVKFSMPENLPAGLAAELAVSWPDGPEHSAIVTDSAGAVIDQDGSVRQVRAKSPKELSPRANGRVAREAAQRPGGSLAPGVPARISAAVRKADVDQELRGLVEDGSILFLRTRWEQPHGGARCAELHGKWLDWFKTHFNGVVDLPYAAVAQGPTATPLAEPAAKNGTWLARLKTHLGAMMKGAPSGGSAEVHAPAPFTAMAKLPLAMLAIPSDTDAYLAGIGNKSRNMLRKAARLGYTTRPFVSRDFLDDVHAINISKESRGGMTMTAGYLEYPKPFDLDPAQYCSDHNVVNIGCFKGDRLVAYCSLVCVGELGIVNRILGHGDHLADGIMNQLVFGMVEYLIGSKSAVRAVNYLTLRSRTEQMDAFKRHVGFRPAAVVLVDDRPSGERSVTAQAGAAAVPAAPPPAHNAMETRGTLNVTSIYPPFNPAYFSKRGIEGLAPAVADHRKSGFRAALKCLNLPQQISALDVGAGGFAGQVTTAPLLELLNAKIDAVEINAELADGLRDKFGSSVNVVHEDFARFQPKQPYDLAVFDLDSPRVPRLYNEFLDKVRPMLKPRGKIISLIIYDCDRAFASQPPLLNPAGRDSQRKFLLEYFGVERLDLELARQAMWPKGYAVLGMIDKWMGNGAQRAIGWLVLEKLDPA